MQASRIKHYLTPSQAVLTTIRQYAKDSLKCMQGWQAFEYGSPDVLQLNPSLSIPAIRRPNDVLIKVHAASINPLDVMMLRGYGASLIGAMRCVDNCSISSQALPLTLGRDFSGTVVSTGGCVKSVKPGDEVFGVVGPQQPGSHAEYVITPSLALTKKPPSLNHIQAASFPYAALTAWSAISTFGELSKRSAYGKRVLVLGASGGVGSFAVQLLKAWGADVTATCATDAMEMIMNIGADNVVDYLSPDYFREMKQIQKFDFILDTVGGENQALGLDLLRAWGGSKYVTVVSPLMKNADDYGLIFGNFKSFAEALKDTVTGLKSGSSVRWAYILPNGYALKSIAEMIESKQILPIINEIFPFDQTPDAYRKVLDGHARGKTIIDFFSQSGQEEELQGEQIQENNAETERVKMS